MERNKSPSPLSPPEHPLRLEGEKHRCFLSARAAAEMLSWCTPSF